MFYSFNKFLRIIQTIKMFLNNYKEVFLKQRCFYNYFYSFDKFLKSPQWANFLKLCKL